MKVLLLGLAASLLVASCTQSLEQVADTNRQNRMDRANADYILENVLDPSAAVSRDYTITNVATSDGRLIAGIIREQNDAALVVQTANERIAVPREDVEAIKPSTASMMPEGQLETLSDPEIRDLFAYLASTSQVPLAGGRP